jgi:ATP-binding cassette subfamily E protein 1
MATYLADRVIVFEGSPSIDTTAHTPQTFLAGMNRFLELLGITFRRDPNNFRPRINKNNSVKVSMNLHTSGLGFKITVIVEFCPVIPV